MASGFDTPDNKALSPENLPEVFNMLKTHFGKRLNVGRRAGLDENSDVFELEIDNIRITIGWDI